MVDTDESRRRHEAVHRAVAEHGPNEQMKARLLQRLFEAVEHDVAGALTDAMAGVDSLSNFVDDPSKRREMQPWLPQLDQLYDKLNWVITEISFTCSDCGTSTDNEYYVVKSEVWDQATAKQSAHQLCIGCLETRIGRKLCKQDFLEAPVNDLNDGLFTNKSERLRDRLTS